MGQGGGEMCSSDEALAEPGRCSERVWSSQLLGRHWMQQPQVGPPMHEAPRERLPGDAC